MVWLGPVGPWEEKSVDVDRVLSDIADLAAEGRNDSPSGGDTRSEDRRSMNPTIIKPLNVAIVLLASLCAVAIFTNVVFPRGDEIMAWVQAALGVVLAVTLIFRMACGEAHRFIGNRIERPSPTEGIEFLKPEDVSFFLRNSAPGIEEEWKVTREEIEGAKVRAAEKARPDLKTFADKRSYWQPIHDEARRTGETPEQVEFRLYGRNTKTPRESLADKVHSVEVGIKNAKSALENQVKELQREVDAAERAAEVQTEESFRQALLSRSTLVEEEDRTRQDWADEIARESEEMRKAWDDSIQPVGFDRIDLVNAKIPSSQLPTVREPIYYVTPGGSRALVDKKYLRTLSSEGVYALVFEHRNNLDQLADQLGKLDALNQARRNRAAARRDLPVSNERSRGKVAPRKTSATGMTAPVPVEYDADIYMQRGD